MDERDEAGGVVIAEGGVSATVTADEFAGWFWRQPANSAVAAMRATTRRTFRRAMRYRMTGRQ